MKKSLILKQVLLAILILSFSSVAFALDFSTGQLVESGDFVGFAKDSICGPDGRIHLSYMNNSGDYATTSGDVKYAVYDGNTWRIETVIAPNDYLGSNTSIAIDNSGYPHIIYNYSCNAIDHPQDLDHAWWDGSQWQTENIFDGQSADYKPGHPSLEISDNNVANVVFHVRSEIYWARKQLPSGSGSMEIIPGVTGSHTSMALDSNGYPHISYRKDCDDQALGYSYYDGTSWIHEEVVSEDAYACGTCIDFDPEGNPCISYSEGRYPGHIYYAYKDDSVWAVESVDIDSYAMWEFTNLDFASDGTPFITYMDEESNPGVVKVAKKDSVEGWTISPIYEEAGNLKGCQLINTSMVVDEQNFVHVFFNGYNASDDVDADIYHAVADTGIVADTETDTGTGSSSSGGCNTGALFPSFILLLAPLFLLSSKR